MKLNLKMLAVSAALLGLLAAGAALPASAAGPLNAAAALSLPWSPAAVESVETGTYASTMTVGTQQQLSPVILPAKAARKATVTFISNDSTIVNVTSEGVAQAVGVGTAQVIASADGVSCVYTITTELDESMIVKEMDITLASGTIAVGETTSLSLGVLPSSASNYANVSLSSSDPAVATVNNFGKVTGVAPGTATITFTDDAGATATCQVTVTAAEDVRSAYAEGNIVARNTDFDLVAITDTSKTEVRFEIVSGSPATGAYTTTSYEEESQVSSYGLPTNNVHVFRRTVQFTAAGTYTVRAYSRSSSSASWSSDYYEFTVQVTSTNVSATTATDDVRRASGEIITVLGDFEGFVPEIEADPLVAGSPTVGYGLVIQPNGTFYNNMTRDEAYALLVNTVNKESYASAVESYRASHNIKMSQAQFDALTSFVYNHGPGVLSTQYGYMTVLLNAVDPSDIDNGAVSGTINNTDVDLDAVPVYSTPGGSSRTATLGYGVTVSVTDYEVYRSSTQQEVWYYVTAGSVKGWISAGYVKLSGSRQCDLTYVDSTVLANNFLQWNTGGIEGLVNRRIAECNIFFFGDYEKAMKASGYWGVNYYGYHFPDDIAYLDSNQ